MYIIRSFANPRFSLLRVMISGSYSCMILVFMREIFERTSNKAYSCSVLELGPRMSSGLASSTSFSIHVLLQVLFYCDYEVFAMKFFKLRISCCSKQYQEIGEECCLYWMLLQFCYYILSSLHDLIVISHLHSAHPIHYTP